MPVKTNGKTYYRSAEVYRTIGISRNTLFRWLHNGVGGIGERRDRRGWRLFSEAEVESLRVEANRVIESGRGDR